MFLVTLNTSSSTSYNPFFKSRSPSICISMMSVPKMGRKRVALEDVKPIGTCTPGTILDEPHSSVWHPEKKNVISQLWLGGVLGSQDIHSNRLSAEVLKSSTLSMAIATQVQWQAKPQKRKQRELENISTFQVLFFTLITWKTTRKHPKTNMDTQSGALEKVTPAWNWPCLASMLNLLVYINCADIFDITFWYLHQINYTKFLVNKSASKTNPSTHQVACPPACTASRHRFTTARPNMAPEASVKVTSSNTGGAVAVS